MHFMFINNNINTEIIHMPGNTLIDELKKINIQLDRHQQIVKYNRGKFDLSIFKENLEALERLFNAAKQNHRIFDQQTGTPAFVAGLMHKLGVLAKNVNRGQSQRLLNAEHGLWLLNLLITDGRAQTHHPSMAIYGLGQLAKAGMLYGAMRADILQACLTKLKGQPNLDTQGISNSLHGLKQLMVRHALAGTDSHPLPIIPLLKPLIDAVKDSSAAIFEARSAFLLVTSISDLNVCFGSISHRYGNWPSRSGRACDFSLIRELPTSLRSRAACACVCGCRLHG